MLLWQPVRRLPLPTRTFLVASVLLLAAGITLAQKDASPTALSSTQQLENLSGEYDLLARDIDSSPLSFYVKDGKFFVESEQIFPTQVTVLPSGKFSLPDATFHFNLDASGHATSVLFSNSPESIPRVGDAVHHTFHDYQRSEVTIPMRDGVKLHAIILKPADIKENVPFLLTRTPYGVDGTNPATFLRFRPEIARAGYIYVAEDIRGRFKSEGQFVMCRPLADHSDPKAIDESTDAYDTIDWLLKHVPNNNSRVGVIGTSYPGFLAMMAGIDPHPAVKAISPQAPMIDTWLGDDFFHNGAFRQTYGYDYALGLESSKETTDVDYGKGVDGYDYFLQRGSFAEDVKQSGVKQELPTWANFIKHPAYDSFWYSRGVEHHLNQVTLPTLTVGGYYDQEDMWGPQEEYATLEPHDSKHENFLVLGPWRHGSWSSWSRHLGALQYGESIGREYRAQIEAKFFAKYLKDEPGFDLEDTASFQTGSNTWKRYAHFPPAEAKSTAFSLCGANTGSLGTIAVGSTCEAGKLSYVADPANPVPYRHRPIQPTYGEGSKWGTWMVEDQRFVTDRKDVAVWRLPVQTQDLTITGEVFADIFATTTGTDSDFVAKLIDVYPDDDPDPAMRGFQLMTNMEIFRGRYRTGFDNTQPLKPGEVNEFKWSLHGVDHVFKKGHAVMVEIQSTWFPLYDRNPQTFVPNIMLAKPEDYKPATITIVTDSNHPSQLILPVMP